MDFYLKLAQLTFYVVASVVALLTYRSAKRGLLNTVNTEYQKRVMDRLKELSDELASEFAHDSENHWARQNTIQEYVAEINRVFVKYKRHILARGKFNVLKAEEPSSDGALEPPRSAPHVESQQDFYTLVGAIQVPGVELRMKSLARRVKADPFIPKEIRDPILELFETRLETVSEIHKEALGDYKSRLAAGERISPEELQENWAVVHNLVNRRLYERGCGIGQIEKEVDSLRLLIQAYFESFNPIRRRLPRLRKINRE